MQIALFGSCVFINKTIKKYKLILDVNISAYVDIF